MIKNELNKKLVNHFILGSFLCGISAGMITQVQGTQRPSFSEKYKEVSMKTNIVQLEDLLFQEEIPVNQCEKLIKEKRLDLNRPIGPFYPLEKAVVYGKPKAVQFLLE
jgi:hypothetical protein